MVLLDYEIPSYTRSHSIHSLEFNMDVFDAFMFERIKQRRWAYKAQRLIYARSSFLPIQPTELRLLLAITDAPQDTGAPFPATALPPTVVLPVAACPVMDLPL